MSLELFKKTLATVEAYRHFLEDQGFDPKNVVSMADFVRLPLVTKDNYLRKYQLSQIVPNGKIPPVISSSSGSSGKPYYWPRGDAQEEMGAQLHEEILRDIFKIGKSKTLIIVCFSMGSWVAGTFTLASCRALWSKYNITVVTPGIEREDILAVMQNFAPQFERVVLAGYPPFLMDVMNEAVKRNFNFSHGKYTFITAGENFSEKWRDVLLSTVGSTDPLHDLVNIYGTADACALGHETPLSIFLRRKAMENIQLRNELFGDLTFIPTLVAYDPNRIYFETVNDEIVFSVDSGIPLIRYNIKDNGHVYSRDEITTILDRCGHTKEAQALFKGDNLPLVGLFGRKDVSTTFYALNIYPENIKAGLEDDLLRPLVSGKFVIRTEMSKDQQDQKLLIYVELAPQVKSSVHIRTLVRTSIFNHLIELNAEYRKLYNSIKKKALPKVIVEENGHAMFAIRKNKMKWIIKTQ